MSTEIARHENEAIENSNLQDGGSEHKVGQPSKSAIILDGATKGHKRRGTVTVTVSKMDDTVGPTDSDASAQKNDRSPELAETSNPDDGPETSVKDQLDEDTMADIGTVLSLFFQDTKGKNVVDALVQNTKVHHKISQHLERIADLLDKQLTHRVQVRQ